MRIPNLLIGLVLILLSVPIFVMGQEDRMTDRTPKKRLKSPALARGFTGGESHDSYVIYARKGQTISVRLSWDREGDNKAYLTVSESPDFFEGEPIKYGKEFNDGRLWIGKIPKTRNYYIYVVAHPTAHYKLRVRIR